jgi:hypothetical protein
MEGQAMSKAPTDIILELRTLARLIETKAPATFGDQDAAHLRAAADEIEVLRKAVVAEREEILELIQSHRADAHMYIGRRSGGPMACQGLAAPMAIPIQRGASAAS